MEKLIFLISILFFISCSNEESFTTYKEMKSDTLLSESFTDNELENLAKIVDFFDKHVSEVTGEKNIEEGYDKFLKQDSINMFDGNNMYHFKYKLQEKLYEGLDTAFLYEFWGKGTRVYNPRSENEIKSESFYLKVFNDNDFSKYSKFIRKLGVENQFIKEYFESIEVMNSFMTPATPINLTYFYKKHNKKDIKIRLIYSFHYLNSNEEHKHLQ